MVFSLLTKVCIVLATSTGIAGLCLLLHECGICPIKTLKKLARKLSLFGLCVFSLLAAPLIRKGSAKVGTGGTNNAPQNLIRPPNTSDAVLPCPAPRALTPEDYERGFVMYRVGTNETFHFSASPDAAICSDWQAFGAATDWIYTSVKWKM